MLRTSQGEVLPFIARICMLYLCGVGVFASLGGEEFALLPRNTARKGGVHVVGRIRKPLAYFLAEKLSAVNAPWSGPHHPADDFPPEWPYLSRHYFTKDKLAGWPGVPRGI